MRVSIFNSEALRLGRRTARRIVSSTEEGETIWPQKSGGQRNEHCPGHYSSLFGDYEV